MRRVLLPSPLLRLGIVPTYLLLMGALFFLWPVVVGIPTELLRLLWIAATVLLLAVSAWNLQAACREGKRWTMDLTFPRAFHWWLLLPLLILLTWTVITLPPLSFSDEILLSVPTLSLAYKAAAILGWPLLWILTVTAAAITLWLCSIMTARSAACAVVLMTLIAIVVALVTVQPHDQVIRFPPMVHLIQLGTWILGGGNLAAMRLSNVFWTVLLGIGIWQIAPPSWTRWSKTAAFAALLLGPMGWIYHIQLYQACAEITLGFLAILLIARIVTEEDGESLTPFPGMIFGTWILVRPTALAAAVTGIVLLLAFGRVRSARRTAGIALPIALSWYLLAPIYTKQYGSVVQNALDNAGMEQAQFLQPLWTAMKSLPSMFHPAVILLLLLASGIVLVRGGRSERITLAVAWLLGGITGMAQLQITPLFATGTPRYAVLLLLPCAAAFALLFCDTMRWKRFTLAFGVLAIVILVMVTPFRVVSFLQETRKHPEALFRTAGAGETPLPVAGIALEILKRTKRPIILAPDISFLEAAIAMRLITPQERNDILNAAVSWTPASPVRPVIVQSPLETTYRPQRSADDEGALRAARAWALKQPGHEIVRLGIEETVIVP